MTEQDHTVSAAGVIWNLVDLYSGNGDAEAKQDLEKAAQRAQTFAEKTRPMFPIKDLGAENLLSAMKEYEAVLELGLKPYTYAALRAASDTLNEERQVFFGKVHEMWHRVTEMLAFFEPGIINLPEGALKEWAESPALKDYRHFLLRLLERKPHTLKEPEERIMRKGRLSGRAAFSSLYDEIMATLEFGIKVRGKSHRFHGEEALALLRTPDRPLRERAYRKFLEELGRRGMIFRHMLNAMLLDVHLENRERGYDSPVQPVLVASGVGSALMDRVMDTTERHYSLARDYFRMKAPFLGLNKLRISDLSAPLPGEHDRIDFLEAKKILLNLAGATHPLFHRIVLEIFEKQWIDGEVRQGKQGGGFCKCLAPSYPPYISLHYSGHLRHLSVLAHELGHAVHYRLSSGRTFLGFEPSPLISETASTFFEILLTGHLLQEETSGIDRASVMANQIEGFLTTVFRQNVLTRFELAIHRLRQDQPLTEEKICSTWWEENKRLYGSDVEMPQAYRWGWTCIPHFFHRPFYCWNYIFGNLLAIILYVRYCREKDFLGDIIRLLSAGASRPPLEMLSDMGLNVSEDGFWDSAFGFMEERIDALAGMKGP
ncbi:MAG: M3 family oligoendopeptidase [Pseudomonadota bacterium]